MLRDDDRFPVEGRVPVGAAPVELGADDFPLDRAEPVTVFGRCCQAFNQISSKAVRPASASSSAPRDWSDRRA